MAFEKAVGDLTVSYVFKRDRNYCECRIYIPNPRSFLTLGASNRGTKAPRQAWSINLIAALGFTGRRVVDEKSCRSERYFMAGSTNSFSMIGSQRVLSRLYAACITLLIASFAFQLSFHATRTSATVDEPVHILAGHRHWECGDFGINPEHPPLLKLLATMPLETRNFNSCEEFGNRHNLEHAWLVTSLPRSAVSPPRTSSGLLLRAGYHQTPD